MNRESVGDVGADLAALEEALGAAADAANDLVRSVREHNVAEYTPRMLDEARKLELALRGWAKNDRANPGINNLGSLREAWRAAMEMYAEDTPAEAVADGMVDAGQAAAEARMCMKCGRTHSIRGTPYCVECGEHPYCPNCQRFFDDIGERSTGYKGKGLCRTCHEQIHADLNAAAVEGAD